MKEADYSKILDDLMGFAEEAFLLANSLAEEGTTDVDDWGTMLRWVENAWSLIRDTLMVRDISALMLIMESPKDEFEVQKVGKSCCKQILGYIDTLIMGGRLRKMNDYRCIDFVKRFVNYLDGYKQMFEE